MHFHYYQMASTEWERNQFMYWQLFWKIDEYRAVIQRSYELEKSWL